MSFQIELFLKDSFLRKIKWVLDSSTPELYSRVLVLLAYTWMLCAQQENR